MLSTIASVKRFAFSSALLAIVTSVVSILLLMPQGARIWLPFGLALLTTILHICAAVILWHALRGFRAEMRNAYKFICVAIVFVGFTQLQLPIVSVFDLWFLREIGVIVIPFVIPFIFFAIGIKRFAGLLNIRSRWSSPWIINLAGLTVGAALAFVPRMDASTASDFRVGLTMVLLGWIATHALALIMMVLRIKQAIGVHYVNSMAWLSVTYASVLATTVMYIATLLLAAPGNWYLDYNISVAPFVIVGLLWLRTAYAFNFAAEPRLAPNELGSYFGPAPKPASQFPSVDIVLDVAQQVSDVRAIDPLLDDVRGVTATMNDKLTEEQQQRLAKSYLEIERYLATQDPLRKFTIKEIRDSIELRYDSDSLNKSFWPRLAPSA